jgi:hypothetical protein
METREPMWSLLPDQVVGWEALAAETFSGVNQVMWMNLSGHV